jgi:hypothetical protein
MSTTKARFRAAIVAIAPAVLLFAFLPAMGIVGSEILGRRLIWLVAGAVVVMAAASFVSLGAAPYVGAATAIVALWPLAYELWRHSEAARPATQPQPMSATRWHQRSAAI